MPTFCRFIKMIFPLSSFDRVGGMASVPILVTAVCFSMSAANSWLLSEGLSDDISRNIQKTGIH